MNKSELERAIADEVEAWPGVTVEFINGSGGGNPKAKFKFGDLMLSRAYPSSSGDVHRCLGDMRRILKQLGAERDKPAPTDAEVEKRYHKPNEGADLRPDPVKAELVDPKPDIADQLVLTGAATPEQAEKAKAPLIQWDGDDGPDIMTREDLEAAAEERRAAIQAAVDAIVDGIYFGLADEIYHAVPRLGSTNLCNIMVSPGTFWNGSWLDPERPPLDEEQTAAQALGKAYHAARLEPETFDQKFVRQPDKRDLPKGSLYTEADIKAALKELGQAQSKAGESVLEKAHRLIDCGWHGEGLIWHIVMEQWEKERGDRKAIKAEFWDDIVIDMERLRGSGRIAELLSHGAAEVSIFWTDEHGLKCKCRFDYLKSTGWRDFKTFANPKRKPVNQAITDAFRYDRYYIQATHYRDGAEAIRTGGLQIIGDATDAQRELIAKIQIKPEDLDCWYIFQEKGRVPNLLAREFKFWTIPMTTYVHDAGAGEDRVAAQHEATRHRTKIHTKARMEIRQAKEDFVLYSRVYQPGIPWAPIEPMGTIDDLDFNDYWLDGGQ